MGNYCKSYKGTICNNNSSKYHDEQINHINIYDSREKIAQFWHNVVIRAKVQGVTALQLEKLGEDISSKFCSFDVTMAEFWSICSMNYPAGLTDDEWERFVSSVCLECFRWGGQNDLGKVLMKIGTFFAMSVPRSSSQYRNFTELSAAQSSAISTPTSISGSSVNAVVDLPLEELTSRSRCTASLSSAESAGHEVLPNEKDYLGISHREAILTHIWPQYQIVPDKSRVSSTKNDKIGEQPFMGLQSRYTTICLGDMPSNRKDEALCHEEKKTSTESNIYPAMIVTGHVGLTGNDEIKVKLRVTQTV